MTTASDHAFEAFLAGLGPESFEGDERRRYMFYRQNPGGTFEAAVEAAIEAYASRKGKRK